jgi:steroid delta-isomerase-like uncharacterized protein
MYKEQINALIAAWNTGNLNGLDAFVATNAVRLAPASLNSNANSLAELKKVITDFRTAFPDTKVTIDEQFFLEGRSFLKWTFTGRNTGPGVHPPTGKAVKVSGASLSRYEGGKLVEESVYFDALEFFSQLGLIEIPKLAAAG